jgi:uncharacterized protein
MTDLARPGVYVNTSSFPTYVSASPGVAEAAFVGWTPRGPLAPTVVNSWKQYTQYYGGFETQYPPSPLTLAVFCFFSAGGTSAVIIRVIPSATPPVAAYASFDDQSTATSTPPGPIPTLEISASNPGAWGNNLWVNILPGTILTGATGSPITFTIQVMYGGNSPANIVEVWQNLSMVPGSTNLGANNYAIDVVNSPYSGSGYITLSDLHSASAPPIDNPKPTTAAINLSGGTDGSNYTFQDQLNAVQLLDQFPNQPFVLNCPGLTNANDVGSVVGYAEGRGDVFVVCDCPPSYTPATMAAFAQGMSASAQLAIYYPQVSIANPYSPTASSTLLVPPGGFVTGIYIATDAARGVGTAPAGLGATLLGVYGLETTLSNADQATLTQANVNCLISIPGSGVVVWGARTMSPYLVTRYVPTERSLIYLQDQFVALTNFAVFEPNDYVTWGLVSSVLNQFLGAFWQSGGLQGATAAQAYYVTCDDTVNTPSTIQQGILNVEVGVALQVPAEFVVITIGQWAGGATATVATT